MGGAMGKNGGTKADTILTLEEALRHFKRKREVGSEAKGEGESEANAQQAESSATAEPAGESGLQTAAEGELKTPGDSASGFAQHDGATAGSQAAGDIVVVIGGT